MEVKRSRVSSAIRTEGGLLPADLLGRIAVGDRKVPGLTETDYGLEPGVRFGEAITRSWNRLVGAWGAFAEAREAASAGERLTTATRERFLLPLFEELGFGRLSAARAVEIGGTAYPVSHAAYSVPAHLVAAGVPLDKRTAGVRGAAGAAPHALVQELLNRSDERLWGFVSNGRTLRLLRDNVSLTRQAYLEFDLEAIFSGRAYADFTLLWLVCHRSRFSGARHEDWLIERWTKLAAEEGTRALESLRGGVNNAIETLGVGFLAGPNVALQQRLRSGALDKQDYYRQLLRLVYRLIFLFTAEDRRDEATGRELLLDPKASDEAVERYRRYYSTARLRTFAVRRRGTRHGDLWAMLRRVIGALGSDEGAPTIGLPALGSFLFGPDACPDLDAAELRNEDLLAAIRQLATIEEDRRLRTVDYANLGAEELGSVYESLLELNPRLEMEANPPVFSLSTAAGNERKTSGSYYTPTSLINVLLDSALDPVLDEAVAKPEAESAILALSVVDPAAGSGHFLVAAAHRIAKRLAAVRTGEGEPPPPAVRHALRDVISHCIYAVDINPMAVELCKVSLWLEALEPGKPLTFLDAHIKSGNSLLGTTPELVEAGIPDEAFTPITGDDKAVARAWRDRNRKEREGQQTLFDVGFELPVAELAEGAASIDALTDDDPEALRAKEERNRRYLGSEAYRRAKLAADAWCTAFVAPKTTGASEVTSGTVRALGSGRTVGAELEALVADTARNHVFFHWPLEFPQVFAKGGFGTVVGNPPYIDSETLSREAPRLRAVLGSLYSSASGNWDMYVVFVDLATNRLSGVDGYVALLTPARVVAADYCASLQEGLLSREIASFHDFSRVDAFADASVAVGSLVVRNSTPRLDTKVAFVEYAEDMSVARIEHAPQASLNALPPGYIGFPIQGGSAQLLAVYAARSRIASIARVSDGASTAEAYKIREVVRELSESSLDDAATFLLVNTGTIDPFHIRWGEVPTAYLRGRFDRPVVTLSDLERVAPKRLMQAQQRKAMVGGMGSRLEAVADEGAILCGKSAVLLLPHPSICPFALAGLLNSAVMNELYRGLFGLRGMGAGSMNIGPRQIEQLPVPLDLRTLAPASRQEAVGHLYNLAALDDEALRERMVSQLLLSGVSRLLHRLSPADDAFKVGSHLVDRLAAAAIYSRG